MGFKDNLTKDKSGRYVLKSKTKKAQKGVCLYCGQDSITVSYTHLTLPTK